MKIVSNCPSIVRQTNRNVVWWNEKKARKLLNRAKKDGKWDQYAQHLTEYNKAQRKAKTDL